MITATLSLQIVVSVRVELWGWVHWLGCRNQLEDVGAEPLSSAGPFPHLRQNKLGPRVSTSLLILIIVITVITLVCFYSLLTWILSAYELVGLIHVA